MHMRRDTHAPPAPPAFSGPLLSQQPDVHLPCCPMSSTCKTSKVLYNSFALSPRVCQIVLVCNQPASRLSNGPAHRDNLRRRHQSSRTSKCLVGNEGMDPDSRPYITPIVFHSLIPYQVPGRKRVSRAPWRRFFITSCWACRTSTAGALAAKGVKASIGPCACIKILGAESAGIPACFKHSDYCCCSYRRNIFQAVQGGFSSP